MQLKTIQNKIKYTQLDVSMNLTKQPIFVPVWFLVALLGVVVSGLITNHKIKNAKETAEKLLVEFEKTEQPKTKQINISNKIEHTLGYFEYTIDGYSYVEKIKPYNERLFIVEDFLKQESKLTIKARQAAEQELKKIGLMINDRDIIRQKIRIRQHTRNDLKKLVPQEMIDSFAPPVEFKQEKRTSFNTEAMQTAKPKAMSGSLAQSFDKPLQEKTKQQKDDENRAQSFSNLGFVMNPTYAKRHKIKPSVVAVKAKILNDYLEKFGDIAVKEMHDYGIPASITLAQGLLESNAGDSRLAVDANNHFGIKCFSKSCKKGHCKNYTDDTHKDFFRVYKNVWESYRAHSLFLQRDRYKHLLKLKKTDYKGWAHGLKKAGYATDKRYAYKLIDIIEALKLYEYDKK